MNLKYLFFIATLIFISFPCPIHSQNSAEPFEGISLDHPLPEIFRAGEIYVLQGKIKNYQQEVRITADILLIEGDKDYQKLDSEISRNGHFSLHLYLKYPGSYNFSLKVNYKLVGSRLLKVVEPIRIESKNPEPINNFSIKITGFKPRLVWQTENELVQLEIIQNKIKKLFTISNRPTGYRFDPGELNEFHPDEVLFRIRGARSADGTWYTQASRWSDWQEIQRNLVEYVPPAISSQVKFNQPYVIYGAAGSKIHFDLSIKTTYNPDVYIKRPDGRVDVLKLKSNKQSSDFSIGGETKELFPPGKCTLDYFPQLPGTYSLEINDPYGDALVNIPYYYGNLLPILPPGQFNIAAKGDKFDRDAEIQKMLTQINAIRQKLSRGLLRLDDALSALSQYYSDRMAKENFCDHVAPRDREVLEQRRRKFGIIARVAENVAKAPIVEQAFYNLLNSPAHYAAMIDPNITRLGIGISIDKENNFLIAQHFAADPFPREQLEEFLTSLFEGMKAKKPDLVRLNKMPDKSYITKTHYTALSTDRLAKLVLSEKSYKIWGHKSVGQVYFESFTQTIDGLKLEVRYYPPVKKKEKE